MIIIYNKNGFKEITQDKLSKVEIDNRSLPKDEKYTILECVVFPPVGKKLVNGSLIPKTEKEKLDSGEITKDEYNKPFIIAINSEFDKACSEIGTVFTGTFKDTNGNDIVNPAFQYDDLSQNRLLKFKDVDACSYWRSVSIDPAKNNINVVLTNTQKNILYTQLLTIWASKFAEKSQLIDGL